MEHNVYVEGPLWYFKQCDNTIVVRTALFACLCWQFSGWQDITVAMVQNNNDCLAGPTQTSGNE